MYLEIGDYIYSEGWGVRRYQITRATDKIAFAGNIKLPREIDDRFSTKEIGGSAYFYAETQENKSKFHRQTLLQTFQYYAREKAEKLSDNQLERIIKIIKETK